MLSTYLFAYLDQAFDPSIIPGLIAALQQALERDSVHFVIIALTVRNEDTFADFLCQAGKCFSIASTLD